MATEELVTEQFQFLGIDVQKEVLTKCVSLCEEYNVDAESFIEQWMAFSLSHLDGSPPTLENLNLLEKKEFSKPSASRFNSITNAAANTGANLTIYGTEVSNQPDKKVLSEYMTNTPKIQLETQEIPSHTTISSTTSGNFAKYASRMSPGAIVHTYGEGDLLQALAKANSANDVLELHITQVPNDDGVTYTKAMFGFELLHEKASTFDNHIHYLSQCILKKANISEHTSVRQKSQTEVVVAGRVECDADARLNSKSVILQGTWDQSLSQAVTVDIDNLKQYSLFPGQVVVMRGMNPRGDKFIAKEVFHDASQAAPDPNSDMMNCLKGTLSMVVVAGPYTTSDNLAYEPLKDFITLVGTQKPHVVIMTGPFIDYDHNNIKNNTLKETYRSLFDRLIDTIGELYTISPFTKIYIVSNYKDIFHLNIYPTPAYSSRRKHPNIYFLPDPCTLNISGFIVGVTGTDVLMHISQEEISLGMGGDKLSRLASHVLKQQTFYPLWPPPAGLCVDAALWAAHAQMPCTPHILVLPSNFRYFIKEVNDCIVVNPEHLTKGSGGGTFAKIVISNDNVSSKRIGAEIVRI